MKWFYSHCSSSFLVNFYDFLRYQSFSSFCLLSFEQIPWREIIQEALLRIPLLIDVKKIMTFMLLKAPFLCLYWNRNLPSHLLDTFYHLLYFSSHNFRDKSSDRSLLGISSQNMYYQLNFLEKDILNKSSEIS